MRDLYAEADLHADEVGGDFAGEADRLGAATAEVHADLARDAARRDAGRRRSSRARAERDARAGSTRAVAGVPELAPYADAAARGVRRRSAALDEPVPVQRVHGDFHLGQVLRTAHGWMLLDFEGEPARPLAERRGARLARCATSPGMLRSFDYAARHLLADARARTPQLAYRAARVGRAQPRGVLRRLRRARPAPTRATDAVLLRAFELDKAVYEVVYEARNRPTWLPIPLGSIERLAD